MSIQFTDRYGAAGPPSWLRGCFAGCEAMGVVPVYVADGDTRRGEPGYLYKTESEPLGLLRALWMCAHAKPHSEPCDGWHFVRCPDCNGTGRVRWWVTVARLPRWVWRGVDFMFNSPTVTGKRTAADVWLAFKCTFLADLGLWRP